MSVRIDPEVTVFFPTPHPSYPSGHSCVSGAMAEVLADQFPAYADAIRARAVEAANRASGAAFTSAATSPSGRR